MILELFILLEILLFVNFYLAYFFKNELLWGISFVLSAILMLISYNVEIIMLGINLMFFFLSLFFGILDIYDKYGLTLHQ
jgi:hypothetical protein